jgi:anti-sigma-K factor RskA
MSSNPPMSAEDRRVLAAELALGLIERDELARARRLVASDPEFAAEYAAWNGRLGTLFEEVEPVSPPDTVWNSIDRKANAPGLGSSNVIPLRRKVGFWQACTGGVSAIAAALALVLVVQPHSLSQPPATQQQPAPAPMVAMLTADTNHPALMASWNPHNRQFLIEASAPMPPKAGRSHQLWVIPADGKPRSMGVMPAAGPMTATLDPAMAATLAEGVTLAVSDEPGGGSPTGAPTGPVIASGKLARV